MVDIVNIDNLKPVNSDVQQCDSNIISNFNLSEVQYDYQLQCNINMITDCENMSNTFYHWKGFYIWSSNLVDRNRQLGQSRVIHRLLGSF